MELHSILFSYLKIVSRMLCNAGNLRSNVMELARRRSPRAAALARAMPQVTKVMMIGSMIEKRDYYYENN
jgi:hypothetical protein